MEVQKEAYSNDSNLAWIKGKLSRRRTSAGSRGQTTGNLILGLVASFLCPALVKVV